MRKLGLILIAGSCALVGASGLDVSTSAKLPGAVAHASLAGLRQAAVDEAEPLSDDDARRLAKLPRAPESATLANGVEPILTPATAAEPSDAAPIPEEENDLIDPGVATPTDVPDEPAVTPLGEVRWTVDRTLRIEQVATNWGMWVEDLRELNPELEHVEWIERGDALVVFRHDPRKPTRSVGSPNRGHLVSGVPLPEGRHWQLREHRPRAFGSRTTIEALVAACERYGTSDPAAPPVRIGEISRRTGGRIAPHVSHRSGRDVDIGYIMRSNPSADERFWRTATPKTIDAPRTWALIEALVATGAVQQIFISAKLQPVIAKEAAKTRSREEVALLFSALNPDPNVHTIVKHESGHRDHMHVRFACEPGNIRCRTQSAKPN